MGNKDFSEDKPLIGGRCQEFTSVELMKHNLNKISLSLEVFLREFFFEKLIVCVFVEQGVDSQDLLYLK